MVSGQVNLIINTRENYFVLPCLLIGSEQYDVRSEIKVILGEGRYCTLIECKPPVVWACLSGIHNANYIVNSIVCAVILVRGSRVQAYGMWPTHGPIHVLDMHVMGLGLSILSVIAKSLAYSGPSSSPVQQ